MKEMGSRTLRILCVVGARPNFMKIAPIMRAFADRRFKIEATLLHTGQHYDASMKQAFFEQLNIPEPDIDLEVGSGSHAAQTAQVMLRFEPVLEKLMPDAILVVGDVNSTIACALVAVKKDIPVIHVEAGLRSGDRSMPEEINRVLTDQISELLFTTEKNAFNNLVREGVDPRKVFFVGNVMIDTLYDNLERAIPSTETIARLTIRGEQVDLNNGYAVVTLHRPSNVDDPEVFRELMTTLANVGDNLPLIFPVHPRTRQKFDNLEPGFTVAQSRIILSSPLGYHEMLGLMRDARLVLTDSGGIQEETTALGVPCLTLRENTERPVTVAEGTNTVLGTAAGKIYQAVNNILDTGGKRGRVPELWDGRAAVRIAEVIQEWGSYRRYGAEESSYAHQ